MRIWLLTLVVLLLCSLMQPAFAQTPPDQPAVGPGGRDYAYGSVTINGPYWAAGHPGNDAFRYYIFEPASPAPAQAPVVLFLHAWLAYDPNEYVWWITHMVLKGHVVVWAQYDSSILVPLNWAGNATEVWHDALQRLSDPAEAHVRPERDSFNQLNTAIVGHSAGGFLAAVVAVRATRFWNNIPNPRAVVSIEPASRSLIPADDFIAIPASTKMLIVTGDADTIACNSSAVQIWTSIQQIPSRNKSFLQVQSDSHGTPALIADHFFPNNTGKGTTAAVDARDYFVTFRLSVATLNCAFRRTDCNIAFGDGSFDSVTMGYWSDGLPVTQMLAVADPNLLSPVSASKQRR